MPSKLMRFVCSLCIYILSLLLCPIEQCAARYYGYHCSCYMLVELNCGQCDKQLSASLCSFLHANCPGYSCMSVCSVRHYNVYFCLRIVFSIVFFHCSSALLLSMWFMSKDRNNSFAATKVCVC